MEHFLEEISSVTNVCENEPMKKHTTFRIGGPARYFAEPSSVEELTKLIKKAKEFNVSPVVIGRGSNLLVSDEGINSLVIAIGEKFSKIDSDGEYIVAKAGASLSSIAQSALANELTGFEFASGIPGSLGGAIYMNAGAYGGEIKDVLEESYYLDENFEIKTLVNHEFSYRKSFYQNKDLVILGGKLKLRKGKVEAIKEEMKSLSKKRREKQPITMPSAGSVFKRPEGHFAGALIEGAGLKGFTLGGASVSDIHAGFIVNNGDATCKDVLDLISHIQNKVFEKYNIMLETEIKYIG